MKKIILGLVVSFFVFGAASAAVKRTVSGRYGRFYTPKVVSNVVKTPTLKIEKKIGFDRLPVSEKKWSYVLAAHPDDEVLCCGTTIQKILQAGGSVKVVIFTNGDAHHQSAKSYGQTRRKESIAALKKIGVQEKDIYFLGFPDDGLAKLSNEVFTSPYTLQSKTDKNSTFPGKNYTQENLENLLRKIFEKFKPRELFLPGQADKHADHQAVGRLAKKIWHQEKFSGNLFFYTIHGRKNRRVATKAQQVLKWSWIQMFSSQFHDGAHKNFLQNFSVLKEFFTVYD